VFSSHELVHIYVRGLVPTSGALVAAQDGELTERGLEIYLSRARTLATHARTMYRDSILFVRHVDSLDSGLPKTKTSKG